jgi:hypothetical protein
MTTSVPADSASTTKRRGFVAFLDMLGFTRLVQSGGLGEALDPYFRILDEAATYQGRNLQYVTFSDSIVLASSSETLQSFNSIVAAVADIQFRLLADLDIPLAGAISCGSYHWYTSDKGGDVVVAGQAIIDAYQYEERLHLVGTMLTPKLIKEHEDYLPPYYGKDSVPDLHDPELGRVWPLPIRVFYSDDIAFRPNGGDAPRFRGYFVMPGRDDSYTLYQAKKNLDEYIGKLRKSRSTAPDPHAQWKYTHAIRMMSHLAIPVVQGAEYSQTPSTYTAARAFRDPE